MLAREAHGDRLILLKKQRSAEAAPLARAAAQAKRDKAALKRGGRESSTGGGVDGFEDGETGAALDIAEDRDEAPTLDLDEDGETLKWHCSRDHALLAARAPAGRTRRALRLATLHCQRLLARFLHRERLTLDQWIGFEPRRENPPSPRDPPSRREPSDNLSTILLSGLADLLVAPGEEGEMGVPLRHVLELCKLELRAPFRDIRRPLGAPSPEAAFRLAVGEPCTSLRIGALLDATIHRVDEPRTDGSGGPGGGGRVIVSTESGLRGTIRLRALEGLSELAAQSGGDNAHALAARLRERYREGQRLVVKPLKIEREWFAFEATNVVDCLLRADPPLVDSFCDARLATSIEDEARAERDRLLRSAREAAGASLDADGSAGGAASRGYEDRAIAHPAFRNVSRAEAEQFLADKPVYSCVVRPSSLGIEHLTLTWKLGEGRRVELSAGQGGVEEERTIVTAYCAHVDIEEEGKDPLNPRALGQRLVVDRRPRDAPASSTSFNQAGYAYSSIDELLYQHVERMVNQHRALRACRHYSEATSSSDAELVLREKLRETPNAVPYTICPDPDQIGFYKIYYILRTRAHAEPVKVVPSGLLYKGRVSADWRRLLDDFKARVRERPGDAAEKARAAAERAAALAARAAGEEKATLAAKPTSSVGGDAFGFGFGYGLPSTFAAAAPAPAAAAASLFPYGGGAATAPAAASSRWGPAAPVAAVPARSSVPAAYSGADVGLSYLQPQQVQQQPQQQQQWWQH